MDWILVGVLAGSLVVSGHPTKEACEGRAVTLRESKVAVKCVEAPKQAVTFYTSVPLTINNGDGR